jgi:hypothetical protein
VVLAGSDTGTFGVFSEEDPLGGAVKVFVLPRLEAPEKAAKADEAEDDARRNEDRKRGHAYPARNRAARREGKAAPFTLSLSALPTTAIEDADIATAATRGVTRPATATGTAMQL